MEELIYKFENGLLKSSEWHHNEHIAITFWYLENYDELNAIVKIKAGLLRYNQIYKTPQGDGRGYHETITMFFIKLAQSFIAENSHLRGSSSLLASKFIEENPRHLETLKKHYRSETLRSVEARIHWVEPDLVPIP